MKRKRKKYLKRPPLKIPVAWECRTKREERADTDWDHEVLAKSPEESGILFAREKLSDYATAVTGRSGRLEIDVETRKKNSSRTTKIHTVRMLAEFHIEWLARCIDENPNP